MARTRRRKMVSVDLWSERTSARYPVSRFWRQASPAYTLYTHGLHAGAEKVLATTSWCRFFLTDEPPEPVSEFQSTWVNVGPDLTLDTEEPVDNFGFADGGGCRSTGTCWTARWPTAAGAIWTGCTT